MSLAAILIASLIGSPHCAGMCGGFALLAAEHRSSLAYKTAGYNLGRLFTYSLLGATAGYAGAIINSTALITGIHDAAAMFVGIFLITAGILSFFKIPLGIEQYVSPFTAPFYKAWLHYTLRSTGRFFPIFRAFCIGSVTTFLPCGWLYVFVAVACASGSPINGVATMAVFWIGTVPVLAAVGSVMALMNERIKRLLPRISAAMIIGAGILSLTAHEGFSFLTTHDHCASMSSNQVNHTENSLQLHTEMHAH